MFDLRLSEIIDRINKKKSALVCLQLPDGLRPRAQEIQKIITEKTGADCIIWAGSSFGSCDVPFEVKKLGVDLLISWGHSEWK